ncbi:MAG: phosphate signaling complex protein PhoU [Anaerolineae bacterium]
MPREDFWRRLQALQDDMLSLGSMVENALAVSVEALLRRDHEASRRLIGQDRLVNEKRYAIENDTLVLIATQQPMAGDLRELAAILEIATELERIGDYAKGIGQINLLLGPEPLLEPVRHIKPMEERVRSMLHRSLDAFVRRDVTLARAIPIEDDEVDTLYRAVYHELLDHIIANRQVVEQANMLLWVAHNLERAADRVTNICERVIFTVTGELVELKMAVSGIEDVT